MSGGRARACCAWLRPGERRAGTAINRVAAAPEQDEEAEGRAAVEEEAREEAVGSESEEQGGADAVGREAEREREREHRRIEGMAADDDASQGGAETASPPSAAASASSIASALPARAAGVRALARVAVAPAKLPDRLAHAPRGRRAWASEVASPGATASTRRGAGAGAGGPLATDPALIALLKEQDAYMRRRVLPAQAASARVGVGAGR